MGKPSLSTPWLVLVLLVLLGGHMIAASPTKGTDADGCALCSSGFHRSGCSECHACKEGSFTPSWNTEETCFSCSRDCRPEFNLEIVKPCTKVSDLVCRCRAGYRCVEDIILTGHCTNCIRIATPPQHITEARPPTSCPAGTFLNSSSRNCDPHTNCAALGKQVEVMGNSTADTVCGTSASPIKSPDVNVFVLVGVLGALGFVAGLLLKKTREALSIKQAFKLCSPGVEKADCSTAKHKESRKAGQLLSNGVDLLTNNVPERRQETAPPTTRTQDTDWMGGATHGGEKVNPPITMTPVEPHATGNLGPFHIYSPGTVFVGLLNQMSAPPPPPPPPAAPSSPEPRETGSGAPARPPSGAAPVPLSQEEWGGHPPRQEQGKDSHLSHEEKDDVQ
ncbi:uncharacterized protein [Lepisosteus oculatus]|uniref:uncharacterized protein n=1 Tax=Lepisosteus oculatus TaxID=7918 RepID=UPI00371C3BB0